MEKPNTENMKPPKERQNETVVSKSDSLFISTVAF